MNARHIFAVMKPPRFISYQLIATPLYKLKVGDDVLIFGSSSTGVYKIHSINILRCTPRVNMIELTVGSKGLGEHLVRNYDKLMGYKAIRIRKPDETITKANQISPKEYGLRHFAGDRREKWNVPHNGIRPLGKNK